MIDTLLNNIINGDMYDILESKFESDSIDLIVTSPPYDKIRDYHGFRFDIQKLGYQIYRILKDGGVCVWVVQDQTKNFKKSLTTFKTAIYFNEIGLNLFECMIYKKHGRPGPWWNSRFRVDHEYILIFFKGDRPKYFNKEHMKIPAKHNGCVITGTDRFRDGSLKPTKKNIQKPTKCPGTILFYTNSSHEKNILKLKHPATFPDKLAEDFILAFSQPNDVVLDPMCGSGTTCCMAAKQNRNFIGIDISYEYCKLAQIRLKEEFNKKVEIIKNNA